jgi:PleD family two-component response regulator
MFFASKIRGAAASVNADVEFIRSHEQFERALAMGEPQMIIVDLNAERLDPFGLVGAVRSRANLAGIPIVAFLSHVQVDLKTKAEQAGIDRVMPRSAFSRELPSILAGNYEK